MIERLKSLGYYKLTNNNIINCFDHQFQPSENNQRP